MPFKFNLQRYNTANRDKQLGRAVASADAALLPGLVGGALLGKRVTAVATGRCHVAAATEDGEMYAFGCGALGGAVHVEECSAVDP